MDRGRKKGKSYKEFLGIWILLLGVLILAVPFFSGRQSNATLLTGWILVVLGFILYIVINRRMHSS